MSMTSEYQRFDAAAFEKAKVYPGGDWHAPQSVPWLWGEFCNVRDFFQDAAYFSDAMLLYIT